MNKHFLWFPILLVMVIVLTLTTTLSCRSVQSTNTPSVTILCYLNGDNDLAQEVFHALDMMETVGSSAQVNVVALVDGQPEGMAPYGSQWAGTRFLRVEKDPHIGAIKSTVLEEWGEENLGHPETLERFIRSALDRFPADRYLFYTFAHSQGVIDTRRYSVKGPGKVISISQDDTSDASMSLVQFHDAIRKGLGHRRFELMTLFSCLSNMVEVGYTLSDVTDYLVASEDEIRLYNQPAGSFQIRGMHFESVIAALEKNPSADVRELGISMVDSHVNNYAREVMLPADKGEGLTCRFSAGMALVNCRAMGSLVMALDELARQLINHSDLPHVVAAMGKALEETQQFASFLNMEYYDLQGFVRHLENNVPHRVLKKACDTVKDILAKQVMVYERHTVDCSSTGMSVYLSNPLIPKNIYSAHQSLYRENLFSKDTQWDEMIDIFRQRLRNGL